VANLRKFYKENRVFVILMGIALICIAIILFMAIWYIASSSAKDVYGNRLDGISDVLIKDDKITEMESSISEMEKVEDVTINVHGKIVYFDVDFVNEATVDDAKNLAISCLDFFEEDYSNYYDIQFLFSKSNDEESETSFPMLGYRKAGKTNITWSNNAK
jgi:hypothetical protein